MEWEHLQDIDNRVQTKTFELTVEFKTKSLKISSKINSKISSKFQVESSKKKIQKIKSEESSNQSSKIRVWVQKIGELTLAEFFFGRDQIANLEDEEAAHSLTEHEHEFDWTRGWLNTRLTEHELMSYWVLQICIFAIHQSQG